MINFYFSILFGYDNVANEFQTKEKQKLTEKKNSLQHVQNSFPPLRGTNPATTTHITCTANFNIVHVYKDNFGHFPFKDFLKVNIVINLYLATVI